MPEPLLSFVSVKWIKPLYKQLRRIWDRRGEELEAIYDTFGDPRPLAACYVEPRLQHHNPADHSENEENISYLRAPAFEAINRFLSGSTPLRDGRSVLFILSDAGMGKTSLLLMLKLGHLFNFWPKHWGCTLLKLGPDILDALAAHPAKGNTVLLLDALDEDPMAFGRIEARLKELLQATENFKRTILSCRTQFFPETGVDSFGHAGRVVIGGYTCPMYFMSLFDDDQVDQYLRKRFPDRARDRLLFRPNPWRDRATALVKPIGSLRFRPLLLSHVESILGADTDLLPTSPSEGGRSWTVLGRFPVTFDDYDRFCDATGHEKPADQGWGRGGRPVINVMWEDANAYCRWLSEQSGATYRLPTEAEWEYACRAGSHTRWSFGDNLRILGDHAWYDTNAGQMTHPGPLRKSQRTCVNSG